MSVICGRCGGGAGGGSGQVEGGGGEERRSYRQWSELVSE